MKRILELIMLFVEELEPRLVLTPPKVAVPPVGTYPTQDAILVLEKQQIMVELAKDYDADRASIDNLTSSSMYIKLGVLTGVVAPLGVGTYYYTKSLIADLQAHMLQLDLEYWYLAQQVP